MSDKKDRSVTFVIEQELYDRIDQRARERRVSVSQVIRDALALAMDGVDSYRLDVNEIVTSLALLIANQRQLSEGQRVFTDEK